jgi:glycerol-3-phosphate dehydrogenase
LGIVGEPSINTDVAIYGGGIAGLWILDELRRAGIDVILIEKRALGDGQTVASQGIIHGGLKYMFDGNVTAPVKAIAEMPVIWRDCLAGKREPNLSATAIRSDCCYLWGTGSIKSRIFMAGSTIALRAAPEAVDRPNWPAALREVPGKVMKVPEQVIDTVSLMRTFAQRNHGRIFRGDLELNAKTIILAAGEGSTDLRRHFGLPENIMQRRPLHMVMARGPLPDLFGHCVGGAKPRITITSARDISGRTIWQIGGQIAEDGVKMDPSQLAIHAATELRACIPGLNLSNVEISTYRIDRAEAATAAGQRPDDVHLISEANIITVFPTKLALAPRLAQRVMEFFPIANRKSQIANPIDPPQLPVPDVANPPWEKETKWFSAH